MSEKNKKFKNEEKIKVGQTVWTTSLEGLQESKIKAIGTRYIYLENDNRRFNKNTLEVSGKEKDISSIVLDKKKYEIDQLKENISNKKEAIKKFLDGVEKISKKIFPKEGYTTNVDLLFSSLKENIRVEGIKVLEIKKSALKRHSRENLAMQSWKHNLIKEIVNENPKLKDLDIYKSYEKNRSLENASKFLKNSYELLDSDNRLSEIYLKNISYKPNNAQIIINNNDSTIDKIKSLSQQYVSHKIDMELESKIITNLLLKKYDLDKYGFEIKSTISNDTVFSHLSIEKRLDKIEKTYRDIEKKIPYEKVITREIEKRKSQDFNVGDLVSVGVALYGGKKVIEELAIVTKKLEDGKLEVNKLLDNKQDITSVKISGNEKSQYIDLSKSYLIDKESVVNKISELKSPEIESILNKKELFKEQKLSDPNLKSLEKEKSMNQSNVIDLMNGIEMMQG